VSAYVEQASVMTGRQMVLVATIALHALVISGLLAMKVIPDLSVPDVPIKFVDYVPDQTPPPEPPKPINRDADMKDGRTVVIQAPGDVAFPEAKNDGIVAEYRPDVPSGDGIVGDPPGNPPHIPVIRDLSYQVIRPTDEFYPSLSRQLAEQGTTVVRVCIGANGRMQGQPTVEATSGFRRLDTAAVDWARQALRFSPATRDGVPVDACKGFRVRFKLR
jgi:TonB family protein